MQISIFSFLILFLPPSLTTVMNFEIELKISSICVQVDKRIGMYVSAYIRYL